MRYVILLHLMICIQTTGQGCVCDPIDSSNVLVWREQFDFIVEGKYLTNLSPSDELRIRRNSLDVGFDFLFKVTSVYKGNLTTSDTIAIVQFDNGSCLNQFELGERYFVLGNKVTEFRCRDDQLKKGKLDATGEYIPADLPPPLSNLDESGIMNFYNCDDTESDYWNKVASNYQTMYVLYCTTFRAGSKTANLIKD